MAGVLYEISTVFHSILQIKLWDSYEHLIGVREACGGVQ